MSLLVHVWTPDITLEFLHHSGGHDTPHVSDHVLAEYFSVQQVVPHVPGVVQLHQTQDSGFCWL